MKRNAADGLFTKPSNFDDALADDSETLGLSVQTIEHVGGEIDIFSMRRDYGRNTHK
jgi:hypothetical protein